MHHLYVTEMLNNRLSVESWTYFHDSEVALLMWERDPIIEENDIPTATNDPLCQEWLRTANNQMSR